MQQESHEFPIEDDARQLAERRNSVCRRIHRHVRIGAVGMAAFSAATFFRTSLDEWASKMNVLPRRTAIAYGAAAVSLLVIIPASLSLWTTLRNWSLLPRQWRVYGMFPWMLLTLIAPVAAAALWIALI
jgi:hypothetical protein